MTGPGLPPPGWYVPTPPPRRRGALKWSLGGAAVVLTLLVAVGATLLVVRNDEVAMPAAPANDSIFQSAQDDRPVAIILADPTCEEASALVERFNEQNQYWESISLNVGPLELWSERESAAMNAASIAAARDANTIDELAKQTPHRLMRQLYQNWSDFARAYRASITTYTPRDSSLAIGLRGPMQAISQICYSADAGSAGRAVSLPPNEWIGDEVAAESVYSWPVSATKYECSAWDAISLEVNAKMPPSVVVIPVLDSGDSSTDQTPEADADRAAAIRALNNSAAEMERLGRVSSHPTFSDIAIAYSLYTRAFLAADGSYTQRDKWLLGAAFGLSQLIQGNCNRPAHR